MQWLVNLKGSQEDIERLLAEPPEGLFATEERRVAVLRIVDPDHEDNTDEAVETGGFRPPHLHPRLG